ncbi:hypothetical protein T492DRAFT_52403 [Pavlovales sp. CCMP2436]|nr:hypothetical protein T492DRAFT_52403 [Pavlovales sp. CCMP2436]
MRSFRGVCGVGFPLLDRPFAGSLEILLGVCVLLVAAVQGGREGVDIRVAAGPFRVGFLGFSFEFPARVCPRSECDGNTHVSPTLNRIDAQCHCSYHAPHTKRTTQLKAPQAPRVRRSAIRRSTDPLLLTDHTTVPTVGGTARAAPSAAQHCRGASSSAGASSACVNI